LVTLLVISNAVLKSFYQHLREHNSPKFANALTEPVVASCIFRLLYFWCNIMETISCNYKAFNAGYIHVLKTYN